MKIHSQHPTNKEQQQRINKEDNHLRSNLLRLCFLLILGIVICTALYDGPYLNATQRGQPSYMYSTIQKNGWDGNDHTMRLMLRKHSNATTTLSAGTNLSSTLGLLVSFSFELPTLHLKEILHVIHLNSKILSIHILVDGPRSNDCKRIHLRHQIFKRKNHGREYS